MLTSAPDNEVHWTATQIAAGVQVGRLDPVDVTRAALSRIADHDQAAGAFASHRVEAALEDALALREAHCARLPLAGVPIAVKDVVAINGTPMRSGSAATDPRAQTADDPIVARLRAAGAIIVGTTETCEGSLWPTVDRPGQIVRNPWNPTLSAGGSSGGSAAVVAAGLVPLATGTDCLGSIRIPASACGLVGVKPSRGLLERDEKLQHLWFGLGEHGVLATTVADVALLLGVLAGQEPMLMDDGTLPGGLRVGVVARAVDGRRFARQTERALFDVVRTFAEFGHETRQTRWIKSPSGVVAGLGYWCAAARVFALEVPNPAALQPRTRTMAAWGRLALTRARRQPLSRWSDLAERAMGSHDVIVMPTIDGAIPPALAWSQRGAIANARNALASTRGLAPLWNMSGNPVVVVPAPVHGSSPIGIQLVGRPGDDAMLLRLAAAYERAVPWPRTIRHAASIQPG